MQTAEIKKILDQFGLRIVKKFSQDQQAVMDTFKAEVHRSLNLLFDSFVALKKQEESKKNNIPTNHQIKPVPSLINHEKSNIKNEQ